MTPKLYQVRYFIEDDEYLFEHNNKEEFNYLYEAKEAFKICKKSVERPTIVMLVSLPLDDLGNEDYTVLQEIQLK